MTGPHCEPDITPRVAIWVPPPHALEQADHAVHALYTHEDEHVTPEEQGICWMRGTAAQAMLVASWPGGRVNRTRVWDPVPHAASHMLHSLQSDTGQGSAAVAAGHVMSGSPHSLNMWAYDGWVAKLGPHRHLSRDTNDKPEAVTWLITF